MATTVVSTHNSNILSLMQYDTLIVTAQGVLSETVGINGALINVINNGIITGGSFALRANNAIAFSVVNTGVIEGIQSVNNDPSYRGFTVNNSGIIQSGSEGGSRVALSMLYGNNQILNSGTITAVDDFVIYIGSGDANPGVSQNSITNDGLIAARQLSTGFALALQAAADADHLTNTGRIIGSMDFGDGTNILSNSGTIHGTTLSFGTGTDLVKNSGSIDAGLSLGAGDDTLDARGGTITGVVYGGLGNDLYILDRQIQINEFYTEAASTDTIESSVSYALPQFVENLTLTGTDAINAIGTDDRNVILGNVAANHIAAKGGNDFIVAGDGDDILVAGAGNDTAFMGLGDDTANGGSGNDYLWGLDGDDRLIGAAGNDTLVGEADDDTLIGGAGVDSLTGGAGYDVFLFNRPTDSLNAAYDRISDFTLTDDLINLASLTVQPLLWRGTGAFVNGAAQVRITQGTNTNVYIDLNGDSVTDMRILLTGNLALTADHFLL